MSEAPLPRSWTSSRAPTSKRRRQGNMQCSKRAVAGLKSRVWSRAKQQQLRHASSPASDGSSSGSTTESMGVRAPTDGLLTHADRSIQSGFYITIAAIPASIALFKLSHQGEDSQPYLTRLLDNTYEEYRTKWARRNDLHTSAIEEAAADRALFLDESNRAPRRVDVRFPECVSATRGFRTCFRKSSPADDLRRLGN